MVTSASRDGGQPLAQPVPDLHRQRPPGLPGTVHGLDRGGDLRIRLRPGGRLHGHDTPILRPGRGGATAAGRIMAIRTTRIENLARPVANKPPGSTMILVAYSGSMRRGRVRGVPGGW